MLSISSIVRSSRKATRVISSRMLSSSSGDLLTGTHKSLFRRGGREVSFVNGEQASELILSEAARRDPSQGVFLQAVEEVVTSCAPVFDRHPHYAWVMKSLVEPERVHQFRVSWSDDTGTIRVNRGYRVQYSSALGPYKGGLRFHPTVDQGVIKFLGFEQIFKNSLTTLPLGAGKGGSDFDPKGKSESEVMRFCQSFMTELSHYIGAQQDVPAGDIGVGGREIGYLFGQYKRVKQRFEGVLTGKAENWGGSLIRPEATGYGCVYFAEEALKAHGSALEGKKCTVSGSGNVAQYTAEKLLDLGAMPVSFSDSGGTIYKPDGFNRENLEIVMDIKNNKRGRISDYLLHDRTARFREGERPWAIPCEAAFPSATQNEVDVNDAKNLTANGCRGVFEGANMPCTPEAIAVFEAGNVIYGPGKAANAGGVAVSGLEMAQNAQLQKWTRDEVDGKLKNIMTSIHDASFNAAQEYGLGMNLKDGANIAGFVKVANAMLDQGAV